MHDECKTNSGCMIAAPPWDSLKGDLERRRKLAWKWRKCANISICRLHWLMPPPATRGKPYHTSTWVNGHTSIGHSLSPMEELYLASVFYAECCSKTGFESIQTWSHATSSASSSSVTGPIQNRLQVVSYLSQPLLWLISLFLWPSHCVHPFQAASFFCRRTDTSYPTFLFRGVSRPQEYMAY